MLARRLGTLRRGIALFACIGSFAWSGVARAEEVPGDPAQAHFESGAAYLEASDYENAVRAFEQAYELSKRPAILLHIATAEERRGNAQAALAALDAYLRAEPNGEYAESTRLRIENLQKRLRAERGQAAPAPAAEPAPRLSGRSKVPGLIVLGAGGAAAITAVITGIMARSEYRSAEQQCSPYCSDERLSSGRTLAWVSTVATGVAILGAGVGVTLLLTSSGGDSAAAASALHLGFGPDGPNAGARLRF